MNSKLATKKIADQQINNKFLALAKKRKEELGVTQKEIADNTLATTSSISKFFNEKEKISFAVAIRMCQTLNISIDEFYNTFEKYFPTPNTKSKK